MLSSPALPPGSVPEPHLYDLVTRDGLRLSPTCEDGHRLVMELLQRLGLASPTPKCAEARSAKGDWNGPVLPILQASPWRKSIPVSHQTRGASVPVPHRVVITVVPTPDRIPASVPRATALVGATPQPEPHVPSPDRGKLLSELVALNLANLARGPKKATPATRDRRYILDMLMDVLGDKPVADVTAQDANAMANVLASWPRQRTDYPEFLGMPAKQVAAATKKRGLRVIQRSTQYKHIMALNAFFNWCVATKAIVENPFHYVDNSRYRDPVPKKRDIFSTQDLQTIFAPKHVNRYTEPHKYWIPLIALFTGMRVNEISQLYVDDVQTETEMDEDGVEHAILYFDITPFREGQSIKTGYSVRRMPVPDRLLKLGFERYVSDVRASGSAHLFPGLQWAEGGPGRTTSRWFNTHHLRNACGITSAKKSLHCFRHTLTTRCERAHVPKSIMQTLNGHSDGQGIDARTYVARGSLLECRRAVDGLKYPPLDLVPYLPERFAAYLAQATAQAAHAERLGSEGKQVMSRRGRRPKVSECYGTCLP